MNLFNKSKNNKFGNLMCVSNIEATKKPIFLIFNTKNVFNFLQLAFIKTLIL